MRVLPLGDHEQPCARRARARFDRLRKLSPRPRFPQRESALQVLNYEIADLNPKHNKGRYDELTSAIIGTKNVAGSAERTGADPCARKASLRLSASGSLEGV